MTGEISSDQAPRFQFIDISSSHARKDARAHVMREFMRMKREEQPDVETPAKTSRKRPKKLAKENAAQVSASKRGRLQETIEDPKDLSTSESDVSAHQSTASDASSSLDAETTLVKRANMRVVTSRSGSPQSPVDASRRDPFQAFPMRLDEEDLPLVDHYITVVPELMCNFKGMRLKSGVLTFNPTRDIILPQAMDNPIAFQATALAFAAGHLARLHGRTHTDQSLKHRIQTLRKLREHFFGQHKHFDDLDIMVAMLSLASCEDRFGDSTAAWIHMRGCVNMLDKLVGKLDFKKDRRLYTYMNWILITMTGYDPCALKVLISPNSSPIGYAGGSTTLTANNSRAAGVEDTMNAINAFVEFLRRIEQLNRANQTQDTSSVPAPRTRRSENFQSGSTLHKLLSSDPGVRPGVRSTQIQRSCRFASAVHLNAVLLELSDQFDDAEQFLKRLAIRIIEQELDWNESTETLMWILLFGDDEAERAFNQSQLTWWVGRTLNIAKRLSERSWIEVSELMLRCLKQTVPSQEEPQDFAEWLNSLHKELLAAPISSHLDGR